MNNIVVELIVEYLQHNRRLVVPTFGAFVVKESGERIFSDLLNVDDGVLASLLRAKGMNEMEAAVTIDRFIFEVRHELEQYGYCRLGEVGTLRREPTTKALRLYPPVQGELPKQTPYVPKPLEPREKEDIANDVKPSEKNNEQIAKPKVVAQRPQTPVKPRKKVDLVMVVAIVIVVAALAAIGYGWYVSNLGVEDDDAAMDALRITPEKMINE